MRRLLCLTLAAAPLFAAPARAGDVIFTGNLLNSCVLNVTTPGVLGASTDGTMLSSEVGTGVSAILAVVAVGASPTLNFTAPTVATPAGFTGTTTTSMRANALSGASHAYGSSAFSLAGGPLIDTITINSRVTGTAGFASGNYTVRSTVTCQQ